MSTFRTMLAAAAMLILSSEVAAQMFKCTDKQHRPANQAECLACHKPLDNVSYVFTLKPLGAAK